MNKFKISLITVMLLLLSISAVSAVGITDYNAPIGFERNPVTFTHGDFEMDLKPYSTFIDYDDYFKTNDDRNVTIINETYAEYTDSFKDKSGALEIIKIDGDEYLIDCSYDELDKSKTQTCLKYLKEFNDVNKFKPIKIEAES
ncbi:MAG: hypothetical protein U0L35_08890 [Methanobrevibacter sp.]|jgi:hypothetical protein|nr:hypothetical protein [Methanobrevibacter sp.]